MLIVDAQIHIWKGNKPGNPNHRQVIDFTAEDVLKEMDAAGVNAAVIHPPGWDPNSNALAIEAARKYPNRFAILGNFPLDKPDSRGGIDRLKGQPGMLGLRFALNQPHQKTWLTDGSLDSLWPLAERAGMPVALIGENMLQGISQIAQRHPGLKLIIDHFARPDKAWSHLPALLATAKFPNVALKATGAPSYASEAYPYRDIHGHIRQLYDAFGPQRMFWGTDITRMPCTWKQCVTMFTEELPWLTAQDKELIMGRALCDWIGWKPSQELGSSNEVRDMRDPLKYALSMGHGQMIVFGADIHELVEEVRKVTGKRVECPNFSGHSGLSLREFVTSLCSDVGSKTDVKIILINLDSTNRTGKFSSELIDLVHRRNWARSFRQNLKLQLVVATSAKLLDELDGWEDLRQTIRENFTFHWWKTGT